MSSELRTKISAIARPYVHFDLEADEIADGVMAVLTPPATAKLPEMKPASEQGQEGEQ